MSEPPVNSGLQLIKLDVPVTGQAILYVIFDPATGRMLGLFNEDGVCIGRAG